MIEIQKWLLQVCVACIIISVLSSFIKNEKVNSSIKSVLALYILVITLNSITGTSFKFDEYDFNENHKPIQTINPEQLVIDNATQSICNQINEKFAQNGIDAICKGITLNINTSEVDNVKLSVSNDEAVKIAKEILGEKVKIVIEEG